MPWKLPEVEIKMEFVISNRVKSLESKIYPERASATGLSGIVNHDKIPLKC
jgi:hypothetical protein